MEIHSLRLLVAESSLNAVLARQKLPDPKLSNVRVAIREEGVAVTGEHAPLWIPIPFEIVLEPSVDNGFIAVRVVQFSAVGIPIGMLKGLILDTLHTALRDAVGPLAVQARGEVILIDPDQVMRDRGLPLKTNLSAVRCEPGRMWIESRAGEG